MNIRLSQQWCLWLFCHKAKSGSKRSCWLFDVLMSHVGHKKNSTLIPSIDGFFRHVTSFLSGRRLLSRSALTGFHIVLNGCDLQSKPVRVLFLDLNVSRGGRHIGTEGFRSPYIRDVRFFLRYHFIDRASGYSCVLFGGPGGPQPVP